MHFTEIHSGSYVNPLRPGGITPYVDSTSPTVVTLFAAVGTRKLALDGLAGTVDLLVETYDTPPAPLPAPPWNLTRVAPALHPLAARARGRDDGARGARRSTSARSSRRGRQFAAVYAPWTTLNRPGRPARLVFYLARALGLEARARGRYRLQVAVFDSQGNSARAGVWITVANAAS